MVKADSNLVPVLRYIDWDREVDGTKLRTVRYTLETLKCDEQHEPWLTELKVPDCVIRRDKHFIPSDHPKWCYRPAFKLEDITHHSYNRGKPTR